MSPAAATGLVLARRLGIALTFLVILLRPGIGDAEVPTQLSNLEVLVVVDRTRSMAALDHDGRSPRIEGAKEDLLELAEALPGARFGMLAFGADARLVLPFTTDANAFQSAVETFYLEGPQDGVGSLPERPVPELTDVLERADENAPDRRQIVVYVGDGEETAEEEGDLSFAEVGELADGGVVLGYGTTKGAVMPSAEDLDPDDGFVRDPRTSSDAISRADLENLDRIADELGVPFEHRTRPGGMERIAEGFESSFIEGEGGDAQRAEHDITWVFGLLLLGLVLLELRDGWRAVWRSRQTLLGPGTTGAAR